ncbi:hypothetical protein PJF56_04610 [Roseofilum sp. BLCC_M91]|uniref:Uncharacterized protein n=1 Tax=Roseofilum halophilum BLCC-M91 TaxID=3022259 RepID=A0ABT7BG35_9CYAN|nr:hypothetical protein [Roseofilum halophilum]MDJ1178139.1 hypothetical protein [Roseofilum halophilum BLCC-M91]
MDNRSANILRSFLYALAKAQNPIPAQFMSDYREIAKQLPDKDAILKLKPKEDNPLYADYKEGMYQLQNSGETERNKLFPPKGENPKERLENISAPQRQTPNITEMSGEVLNSENPQQKAKENPPEVYLGLPYC